MSQSSPQSTFSYICNALFDRSKALIRNRCTPEDVDFIIRKLGEQEAAFQQDFQIDRVSESSLEHQEIRFLVRLAAFLAGVFSLFLSESREPSHESTWLHLNSFLFDALEACHAPMVSRDLLAAVETARGEVCEVYRFVRFDPQAVRIPEECTIFFDALDLASGRLADHLRVPLAVRFTAEAAEEAYVFRSKYSGALERYPIDVRTCVCNDVQRYFPGITISIPDRIIQSVRGTFDERIDQLCPEDASLFSSLLLNIPAIAFALRVVDFYPERFIDENISFARSEYPSWGYAWTVSLSRMFFSEDGKPSEIARRVLTSKQLGPFELIDGILASMSRPWGHGNQLEFYNRLRSACSGGIPDTSVSEILVQLQERSRMVQTIDPSFARQQLGIYIDDTENVRVVQFAAWSLSSLTDANVETQEQRLARGNVVQEVGPLLRERIEEFERLIKQDLPEAAFQRFLEANPFLLASLGSYSRVTPHVILHEDNGRPLIPDFFLEFADRRDSDIVELKLPSVTLDVRSPSRDRLRATVHAAVAQLRTYREWFRSAANRQKFSDATGMKCFTPRAILVLGRDHDFKGDVDRIRLQETLPDWITLRTYDDLAKGGRKWLAGLRLSLK